MDSNKLICELYAFEPPPPFYLLGCPTDAYPAQIVPGQQLPHHLEVSTGQTTVTQKLVGGLEVCHPEAYFVKLKQGGQQVQERLLFSSYYPVLKSHCRLPLCV